MKVGVPVAVVVVAALAALAGAPPRLGATAEGPEPGFTGGFGEPTCTACHFDSPAEPEEGVVVLDGVPGTYEPGTGYELTVTVRDPRLERAGFQLAARFAEGESAGRQAGRLAAVSDRVEVVEHGDPPVLYARQTIEGAAPAPSREATWRLRWTAPAEPAGAVVFHAAANAANYDDSEFGDVIHAASAASSEDDLPAAKRPPP